MGINEDSNRTFKLSRVRLAKDLSMYEVDQISC